MLSKAAFPKAARLLIAPVALSVALAAPPSMAQTSAGMQHGAGAAAHHMPDTPASRAYMESMDKMNQASLAQPMTGDADYDFAVMMRAHHQAAVDMAKAEIEYGKDPELTRMAREIVETQVREIGQLDRWIARNPAAPPKH